MDKRLLKQKELSPIIEEKPQLKKRSLAVGGKESVNSSRKRRMTELSAREIDEEIEIEPEKNICKLSSVR